jgi:VIT1/CCC1 family predicted Fe2+/Mn2+ transporter
MNALYISIVLAAVTLFSVGVFKGYLAGRPLFASGMEFFFIAVGAALFGYLIGLVVQYFFQEWRFRWDSGRLTIRLSCVRSDGC